MKINKSIKNALVPSDNVIEDLEKKLTQKRHRLLQFAPMLLILIITGSLLISYQVLSTNKKYAEIKYRGLETSSTFVFKQDKSSSIYFENDMVYAYHEAILPDFFINNPKDNDFRITLTNFVIFQVTNITPETVYDEPLDVMGETEDEVVQFTPSYTTYKIDGKVLDNLYGPEIDNDLTVYVPDYYLNNESNIYNSTYNESLQEYAMPQTGGIYVLPLHYETRANPNFEILGMMDTLWEIDNNGNINSHSRLKENNKYDGLPYTNLVRNILFYSLDPEFKKLSSPLLTLKDYTTGLIELNEFTIENVEYKTEYVEKGDFYRNYYEYSILLDNDSYLFSSESDDFHVGEKYIGTIQFIEESNNIWFWDLFRIDKMDTITYLSKEYSYGLEEYNGMKLDAFKNKVEEYNILSAGYLN